MRAFGLVMMLAAYPAWAQAPSVVVTDAWARATAASQKVGVAYLTITDRGEPDRLLSASSPAAAQIGLHRTVEEHGIMKMLPVPALDLAPGQVVKLDPGGYHLMMTGLARKLDVGAQFPITLTFLRSAPITVTVIVEPAGASGPPMDHGSMPAGTRMPGMPNP